MKFDSSSNALKAQRHLMSSLFNQKKPQDFELSINKEDLCLKYKLVLVSPSHLKECGIGRYASHAAIASANHFKSIELVETTYQALRMARASEDPCIVIFQHEYSLVDFQYDLGEDDTTSSLICNFSLIQQLNPKNRTAIFMHSLLLHDHGLNRINRQILSASIPIFHANREGCAKAELNFTELGIPSFGIKTVPELPQIFTVGAFGFLSPNKDVRSTLELCANAGVSLRANYAPNNTGSKQSITDARKHVEEQVRDMNVTANITFDFMSDQDLRDMITETSVIYAPQHDFSHYATSASVRFPLAVGRGAIVPPYKCFHDVAAGVQFAQLPDAIQIVKSMAANPEEARRLAEMGLNYAKRSEIGLVYRRLGERLINNEVWCGGNVPSLRLPTAEAKRAKRIEQLDDHDPWSGQNEAGRVATGRGLKGGFFVYEHAQTAVLSRKIADQSIVMDNAPSCAIAEQRIAQLAENATGAAKDLRSALGGNTNYISIVEIERLPSYIQAILLLTKFQLSVADTARMIYVDESDKSDRMTRFLKICENFSHMQNDNKIDTHLLVWGHSVIADIDWMRDIIFPEYLLALPEENFITGVYRSLLRRDPEPKAVEDLRKAMSMGMKKSHIIHAISHSEEGRKVNVGLIGNISNWLEQEDQIFSFIEMSKLIAPHAGAIKSTNLTLRGRIYANVT